MIQLTKIDPDIDDSSKIKQLYEESFPPIERIDFSYLIDCAKANKADLFSLNKDGQFIGFAFLILPTDYAYLFFYAIVPTLRDRGYGTEMIKLLQQYYTSRQLMVDIEVLDRRTKNADERFRRYMFYVKNGFKDTGYEMSDFTGKFRILSTDGSLNLDYFNESYTILPQSFIETIIQKRKQLYKGN